MKNSFMSQEKMVAGSRGLLNKSMRPRGGWKEKGGERSVAFDVRCIEQQMLTKIVYKLEFDDFMNWVDTVGDEPLLLRDCVDDAEGWRLIRVSEKAYAFAM